MVCVPGCAVPIAGGLVVAGVAFRGHLPDTCRSSAPGTWAFVDVILAFAAISGILAALSTASYVMIDRRLQLIHGRWGTAGPTHEDVLARMLRDPPLPAPPDAECP